MKDKFIVSFNIKKVAFWSLISVMFTIVCIYFITLPPEELPDTARLPRGGRIKNKFIIRIIMIIGALLFGVISFLYVLLLIKLILNKLVLKNKEKEFLIIDSKGLLINKWNVFSKQTLIEWKYIKDICAFNPKDYLLKNNNANLENKIIALKLTQKFYDNASFFSKIIYKFNRKFSKGYEIHINLTLSSLSANEVLSAINKYRFS